MSRDKDIMQAMEKDTEKGFRLLVTTYMEPLYWHIRRMVVSHDDAQDATQETLIRAYRSFASHDACSSLRAWLFRIATNEALRLLGKRQGMTTLSLDEIPQHITITNAESYYDSSDAVAARLQQAILRLPPKQQIAFTMRYYDEMSYDEIAEVTGSTAKNCKANYHTAKEKIVEIMRTNN